MMIKDNINANENFEITKRNNTINHSDCRLSVASKRRRGRHGATVSTASLALVVTKLLALSQHSTRVGAFTHSQRNYNVPTAKTKHTKHAVQPRCLSSLKYRDIDSESSLESASRKGHIEIFRFSTATRSKTSVVRSQMKDEHNLSSQKDDQNIVDEYLESISRRYERVHQNESKNNRSQMGFTSALAWLNADDVINDNDQSEDALFVLDLAELASVRLLHKHHLPVVKSQQQDLSTNEDSIATDERSKEKMKTTSLSISNFPKPLTQFLSSMEAKLSQLRKRAKSSVFQLLAILSLASRLATSGGLASTFAILIACTVVMTGWKA